MRLRNLLRNAIMGLVVTVLAMVLLNLLALGWEWVQYGTIHRNGRPVGLYRTLAIEERPRLKPGARLNGLVYRISINSLGFRGPEIAPVKPPNTFRVWCAGGSTTFDIYASSNETTWPARLNERLQAAAPNVRVEVINAGVPGENLWGSLEDFERLAPSVDPDILVIYHGLNDLRKVVAMPPNEPFTPSRLPDLALLRLFARILPAPPPRPEWASHRIDDESLTSIEHQFTALVHAAQERGTAVVLATHAHRAADDATGRAARRQVGEGVVLFRMTPEHVIEALAAMNRLISQIARENGLPLADVRAAVPADSRYWGDATHFTEEGSELAADVIASTIIRAGLLPGE